MGYKKDAIKGISWIAVLRVATRVVAFVKTLILARILLPVQFGAYGVVLLLLGFLEVMTETGVNVILIQEKNVDEYINSALVVSIIRGVFIAFLIIVLTPFIVLFFHSPGSKILLYSASVVPFLRGFINPSVVKFQKDLQFNREFWYRFAIFFVDSFVSILFSWITHSPIGIVIGLIAGVVVEIALSYILIKPLPVIEFHKTYFYKIFHGGKWVTVSGFFNYLFHNADNIVVGRLLGTGALGIYQMAYSFSILPITEISDVFSRVTFPVFTKIAGDKYRLRRAFIRIMFVITLLTLPFGVLLYFFPKEIVSFVLGKKWLAAASVLPMLAIFGVIRAISGSTSALFLAVGKQNYVTVVTFVSILGLIIPIIPLVLRYGIIGAAISALIGSVAALPFMVYYSWRVFSKINEKS